MKRLNKNAIKRGQSLTCLNYAECKHFGRSQTNSMSALLISVVTMIGIMVYGSCSADEDYGDYYYTGNELSTRAEREMGRGVEGTITEWYELDGGNVMTTFNAQFSELGTVEVESYIEWSANNVVNQTSPYVHASCSLGIKNVDKVHVATPSGTLELPLYRLVSEQTTFLPHLSQTYSYIEVDHNAINCYRIEYNSNGTEASRTYIGTTSNITYSINITDKVTYHKKEDSL